MAPALIALKFFDALPGLHPRTGDGTRGREDFPQRLSAIICPTSALSLTIIDQPA